MAYNDILGPIEDKKPEIDLDKETVLKINTRELKCTSDVDQNHKCKDDCDCSGDCGDWDSREPEDDKFDEEDDEEF